jgi:D,D-heptose 1,7-bisphosphate phosphatase
MANRAVFFDRDGVINMEVSYLSTVDEVKILKGVPEAVRLVNQNNMLAVVITNQSGIARGYFTEETLNRIHEFINSRLERESAMIDAFYYCPHHPDDGCDCRKPKTGLLERARKEMDIDLTDSFFIGDTINDMKTATNAGMRCVLVLSGYGEGEAKRLDDLDLKVDFVAENALAAVIWILMECGP